MSWKNCGRVFAIAGLLCSGVALALPDPVASKFFVALGLALNSVAVYIANFNSV